MQAAGQRRIFVGWIDHMMFSPELSCEGCVTRLMDMGAIALLPNSLAKPTHKP